MKTKLLQVKKGSGSVTLDRAGAFNRNSATAYHIAVRNAETGEPAATKFWTKGAFGNNSGYIAKGHDVEFVLRLNGFGYYSLRAWRSRTADLVFSIIKRPAP
jgi:hypothetical protein